MDLQKINFATARTLMRIGAVKRLAEEIENDPQASRRIKENLCRHARCGADVELQVHETKQDHAD